MTINRHKNRYNSVGLSNERQLIVYDIVHELTDDASTLTLEIFDELDEWLNKKAILVQSDAQKDMRNTVKPILAKYGVDRNIAKDIVQKLVEAFV